jgi:N-methylhydantoinase A/oxoprolinase/acetone carboxylase beta subunit
MRGEGFGSDGVEVESSTFERDGESWLRVEARQPLPHLDFSEAPLSPGAAEPEATTGVVWPSVGEQETPVYRRANLEPGATLEGPALVDDEKTTCAVPPGWSLEVDTYEALRLSGGKGDA